MKKTYIYRNEESHELEMLTESQLLAFFNAPFNLVEDKKNGTTFQDFVIDSERAGLLYSFRLHDYLDEYINCLPPIMEEYVLQECEKTFDDIYWVDTKKELDIVRYEKLTNIIPCTIDLPLDEEKGISVLSIENRRH